MASSNLAVLTKGHNIIAAKKRAKREQIKEVVFDDSARREFLTGFHKRKLQKKEDAKKKAIEREKQERLESRREKRKLLAERAAQNAAETEKAYGALVEEDTEAEWLGISGAGPSTRDAEPEREEEYEYDEEVATVTVVEDFDPDTLIHGSNGPRRSPQADASSISNLGPSSLRDTGVATSHKHPDGGPKVRFKQERDVMFKSKVNAKAKNIKYQTNAARKVDRMKQRLRKTEKAERAGGKASRKNLSVRRKR
ncbi:nucleolar protein 12-domain-containing protein [Amylocystis lapponica]|nr:nucleolar protein 12-domain-containing protein [Amylocystis lapponica]